MTLKLLYLKIMVKFLYDNYRLLIYFFVIERCLFLFKLLHEYISIFLSPYFTINKGNNLQISESYPITQTNLPNEYEEF